MSAEAAKQVVKSGLLMSKDKMIEILKKSPSREFQFSPCPNSKDIVIIVRQS